MDNVFAFLYDLWDVLSSFEIYGIQIVPFMFACIGIIIAIRILMRFLGGDD